MQNYENVEVQVGGFESFDTEMISKVCDEKEKSAFKETLKRQGLGI
jgi:hypothetical protein